MTLGERLKEYRLYHDMKQAEVASKLGINYRTLSGWEHDVSKPSPEDLLLLSEIYETSVDSLLGKIPKSSELGRHSTSIRDKTVLEDYYNLPPDARATVDFIFAMHRKPKEKEKAV